MVLGCVVWKGCRQTGAGKLWSHFGSDWKKPKLGSSIGMGESCTGCNTWGPHIGYTKLLNWYTQARLFKPLVVI